MNKKSILFIFVVIVIVFILYYFFGRSGWRKDKNGLWKIKGNPSEELPREIIEDCFNNTANISAGLVVGDCQKRLCMSDDEYCKIKITEVFKELVK